MIFVLSVAFSEWFSYPSDWVSRPKVAATTWSSRHAETDFLTEGNEDSESF